MKTPALTILLAFAFALSWAAEPLMLQPGQALLAGEALLSPGSQSIPCVADWNGDGLPDLIVGYQTAAKLALYLNSGTPGQPVFSTFTTLQAAGTDICLPSGGCGAPAPWVCDFNGDGKRDLLVGSGADGKAWLYLNTNTDATPMLAAAVALARGSAELSVGYRATPYMHDWDDDGLPDLLCGDGNGNVHLFRNVGTRQSPVYTSDVMIQAGGTTLNLGYRSTIRICDWDGDGNKDLIGCGSDNAAWCKNMGNNSSPVLAAPVRLRAPVSGTGLANIDTGYRMRLEICDWNQDGIPDLLIGNWDGYIYLYEGYRFVMSCRVLQPENACVLEWNSAPFLKYNLLSGLTPENVTEVALANLASTGKRTCWTNPASDTSRFFRIQLAE